MTTPTFVPLPEHEMIRLAWPTPNHNLFIDPNKFFARTRVNPDYGKPGFTRDCGRRFHRGCDIAPIALTPTGKTTRVIFTDCTSNSDFESDEPTFVPHDDVFCVGNGIAHEVVTNENISDFGRHIVVSHRWPCSRQTFFTLYAHLAEINIVTGVSLATGQRIGRMGQTSMSADARNWMLVAPHLHFEVYYPGSLAFDPEGFLRRFLPI